MRLFSIADIHGRLDLLNQLLDTLVRKHSLDLTVDKLIFTGDYVDRGPESYGVLERIHKLTLLHPENVIAIAGNHEWMMIHRYTRGTSDDIEFWENNGGVQTEMSFQLAGFNSCPQHLLKWLAFLPFKHEEPGFFFSHAPVPPEGLRNILNKGQPEFTPDELSWGVYSQFDEEYNTARDHGNGVVGVCGHIHALRKGLYEPRFYDHYIFGDAGCGCNPDAPLCAVNVVTRDVVYAWP